MYINFLWLLFPAFITSVHLLFTSTSKDSESNLSIKSDFILPPYEEADEYKYPMTSTPKKEDKNKKYGASIDWQETQFMIVDP
jgi:hypothetical protein